MWPAYLGLGMAELERRAAVALEGLRSCKVCPRDCEIDRLADDIAEACATLEKKGGAHASERKKMKVSPGY